MKAIIQTADLLAKIRLFAAARPNHRVAPATSVTLTVSEILLIKGMGFSVELRCEAQEWGRVVVPYSIWSAILKSLGQIRENSVELAAEDGLISFYRLRLRHPGIKVTRLDNVAVEIPINAPEPDIICKLFEIGVDRVRDSGNWNLVQKTLANLRQRIHTALPLLSEYGVNREDLGNLVGNKLGIEDVDVFVNILFDDATSG